MKKIYAILSFLALVQVGFSQITLTGFGSNELTVDANLTSATFSQTSTSLTITANDQTSTFVGMFAAPVDLSSVWGSQLSFLATVSTNPASPFTVTLYDSNFQGFTFSGNWSQFTVGQASTALLTPLSGASGFSPSSIVAMDFGFGGTGSTLVASLDLLSVAAVPEPSTYAQIALGLGALGLIAYRRRKTA